MSDEAPSGLSGLLGFPDAEISDSLDRFFERGRALPRAGVVTAPRGEGNAGIVIGAATLSGVVYDGACVSQATTQEAARATDEAYRVILAAGGDPRRCAIMHVRAKTATPLRSSAPWPEAMLARIVAEVPTAGGMIPVPFFPASPEIAVVGEPAMAAIGRIFDVRKAVSAYFADSGRLVYVVSDGGNPAKARDVLVRIVSGLIAPFARAVRGGLAATLEEACAGTGIALRPFRPGTLSGRPDDRFIVAIRPEDRERLETTIREASYRLVGRTFEGSGP
ncbi:MAG: hypothetical protein NT080_01200 [Spirochaetes bacterium]|nr:hypothetical protein [Spirochaetota bacterium]